MLTTVLIINMASRRGKQKQTEYDNMKTYGENNTECIRQEKQYYLNSIEKIFSDTC